MKVTVRLFASFAEAAGWREREVELEEGATAADALTAIREGPLHPLLAGARPLLSVNRVHVQPEAELADGDEVGIFPPVSGGSEDERGILITTEPLDPSALAAGLRKPAFGALVTFEGMVRDHNDGGAVERVDYDAYPEMAAQTLRVIRDEIEARFPGAALSLAHRTGELRIGEVSVVVCCGAAHRREAFAACRLAMDRIKEALPVWKHEHAPSGASRWL